MPLARMVSFGRSILNTGELGNNQNVPPASVGISHFLALPPPPQPILVLTLAGPARARGARANNVGRARRARKSGKLIACLQTRTPVSSIATRSFREPAQHNGICHFWVCSGAGWVNNLKVALAPIPL
jgi:hypothetical protein